MLECILDRIFVQLEDIKKEHTFTSEDGSEFTIEIARPATQEDRERASVTEGFVVAVGPLAYHSYGYTGEEKPVKIGDRVQFAKFSGRVLVDPDNPNKRVAVMLDEDILAIIKSKENTNE